MGLYLILYFIFYQYIVPKGTVPEGHNIGSIISDSFKNKSHRDEIEFNSDTSVKIMNSFSLTLSELIHHITGNTK